MEPATAPLSDEDGEADDEFEAASDEEAEDDDDLEEGDEDGFELFSDDEDESDDESDWSNGSNARLHFVGRSPSVSSPRSRWPLS